MKFYYFKPYSDGSTGPRARFWFRGRTEAMKMARKHCKESVPRGESIEVREVITDSTIATKEVLIRMLNQSSWYESDEVVQTVRGRATDVVSVEEEQTVESLDEEMDEESMEEEEYLQEQMAQRRAAMEAANAAAGASEDLDW